MKLGTIFLAVFSMYFFVKAFKVIHIIEDYSDLDKIHSFLEDKDTPESLFSIETPGCILLYSSAENIIENTK